MADAVNAGFARSEQLKKEWASLKREMLAIDSTTPDAANRRHAIHNRMDQVMTDMANVLTETRRLIPTPDINIDHNPPAPSPPQQQEVQYSARKLHIVHRTYDSSSDDSDSDYSRALDNQKFDSDLNHDLDVSSLRQDMMSNANPDDVITVEGKGLRASIYTMKEKLRKPEAHKRKSSDKDRKNAPPPSPRGKPLSTDDREDLALEQSRLERESRRLKRKPERTSDDDSRLEDIANRLSRISSTLADTAEFPAGETELATTAAKNSVQISGKKGLFSSKSPRLQRSTPLTALADNDDELTFGSVDDEVAPLSVRGNHKQTNSKRKKGWMALEAGVASFRAFSRNIRQNATAVREPKVEAGSSPISRGNGEKLGSSTYAGGNAFSETAERLQQRGEKLNGIADEAQAMNNDASDMLAAARTLRQRNQKGGFFS